MKLLYIKMDEARRQQVYQMRLQLERISNASIPPQTGGFVPLKTRRDVTPEMVEDYLENKGSVELIKPDIDLTLKEERLPFPDVDVGKGEVLSSLIEQDFEKIEEINDILKGLDEKNKILDDEYNKEMASMRVQRIEKFGGVDDVEIRKIKDKYAEDKETLKKERTKNKKNKTKFENRAKSAQIERADLDKKIEENQNTQNYIRSYNRGTLDRYTDEIKLMNKGILIDRMVGESDDEFKTRLEQLQVQDKSTEIQVKLNNIKRFKKKMLELYPSMPLYIVEKLLKKYQNDRNEDYDIIKRFPEVRRKFIRIYGSEPRIKENKIYDEMVKFLDKVFVEDDPVTKDDLQVALDEVSADIPVSNSISVDVSKLDYSKVYEDIDDIIQSKETEKTKYKLLMDLLKRLLKYSEEDIQKEVPLPTIKLNQRRTKEGKNRKGTFYKATDTKYYTIPEKKLDADDLMNLIIGIKEQSIMRGRGMIETNYDVKNEDLPKYSVFGSVLISPTELYHNNKLVIRNKLKNNIIGLRDRKVSDEFRDNILSIIKNEPILHSLNENEQVIYDTLITKANLHRKLPQTKNKTIEELKRRVVILEGAINAGNDNVNEELKETLKHLVNLKVLGENEMMRFYKQTTNKKF
jgi:hypothetical protein